jgi:L-ribulokinase
MENTYCIGIDYGTDSVRALLVNADNGEELALSVFQYPRWGKGLYCNPEKNQFRQHPLDYIEGLQYTIRDLIAKVPAAAKNVRAISIDTTGSTPVAVTEDGTPLALLPEFSDNPDAMFILWKDHTAIQEADQINSLCRTWNPDYSRYSGGNYSSEWFWAKILHILNKNGDVAKNAFSWVEHCDWMAALLTGYTDPTGIKRSRCAAGHKAMWHMDWRGLPSEKFLAALNPELAKLRDRLYTKTYTSDVAAGNLSPEWAAKLGLSASVVIGTGGLDAHFGAVGGEIKPYYISKVVGTSTCDLLIAPQEDLNDKLIPGICGQVDGSIVPKMLGLEAGQSAFGDIYAWFRNLLLWPFENCIQEGVNRDIISKLKENVIRELTTSASRVPIGSAKILSLDWFNGRRTPDSNARLKGAITGLTLGTDAPKIFRSLVESTAFGSRKIMDRFKEQGIPIHGIIALGGVAKKSPFVMQTLSDVLDIPIKVIRSENACALGAAMFAAVVAGKYRNVQEAQIHMGSGFDTEYTPIPANVLIYKKLYPKYLELGNFIEVQ